MTTRYDRIMRSITDGIPLLIDGATGTEVERRGVAKIAKAWNAGGTLSHPDTVQAIHEDYIRAGANIIISNTFATHRSALEDAGISDQFEAYNRRSVEIACEARDNLQADHVLVAGGMSHCSFTGNEPTLSALQANAAEQAIIMEQAGAELFMLEMMTKIDPMLAVLDGALASALPVWVGFSCTLDENSDIVLNHGESFAEAIATLDERDVPMLNVMHTDVSIVDQCLDVVEASWRGEIGVYAHSGEYVTGDWVFDDVITPDAYTRYVDRWLSRGVRVIGGCCGIGPHHIEHLAAHWPNGVDKSGSREELHPT